MTCSMVPLGLRVTYRVFGEGDFADRGRIFIHLRESSIAPRFAVLRTTL